MILAQPSNTSTLAEMLLEGALDPNRRLSSLARACGRLADNIRQHATTVAIPETALQG